MELTFSEEKTYTKAEVEQALAAAMYRFDYLMGIDWLLLEAYEDIVKWQSRLDSFEQTTV